jgi:hypothetical protein
VSKKSLLKAYPHLRELDNFSLDIATQLWSLRPQWLSYAEIEVWNNDDLYITINIPCPVAICEPDFLIFNTHSYRITVHFDGYHAHFYHYHESWIEDAIRFMDEIIDEKYIAYGKIDKTKDYTIAGLCLPEKLDEIIVTKNPDYTRSWRGTYNKFFHP